MDTQTAGAPYGVPSAGATIERLREMPTIAYPLLAVTTGKVLISRPCMIVGWTITEQTGSAVAKFQLWNGGSTGGVLVATVGLASAGSSVNPPTDDGILCESGVFLDIVSGQVQGAVYLKA